ncbi:MAG: hypothetical protein K2X93_13075 [Candidatus Obscuribacterales bacterium]|nr:hypothetical protein [Candidatus Obscuribacterales bacterium]
MKKVLAAIVAMILVTFTANRSFAEDRRNDLIYKDQPAQNDTEVKRTSSQDKNGKVVGLAIYMKDGSVTRHTYRKDGTLERSHSVFSNGRAKEDFNYEADGKTVSNRKHWNQDGSKDWESERLADGTVEVKHYYQDGKIRSLDRGHPNGAINNITYRKDGSKWYGRERQAGQTGRGVSLYFAKDGKWLQRSNQGNGMLVVVHDAKNNELYRQTWISGIKSYLLTEIRQNTAGGGWRVIEVQGGKATEVKYFKKDGTLDRTEKAGNLSSPVAAEWLKELGADDPTQPIYHELR